MRNLFGHPLLIALAASAIAGPSTAATLVVPKSYATIQSAVDAADPGDRIKILPGTYVEQVSIDKDLEITGAGADSTSIRAPGSLVPGALGTSSIVEIHGGASVRMSRLTVSGPVATSCEEGAVRAGIHAFDGAHLDLSSAKVTHIQNTPVSACPRSGVGIAIGHPFVSNATADIRYSEVSDYQNVGILVLNEGSHATISHNAVTGPGESPVVATVGIDFALGSTGTVSYNVVSGNACVSPDLGCGPDFFSESQYPGIAGSGIVITHNVIFGNQVGIYVGGEAEISENLILNNQYFGIALQDGSFSVSGDVILGGIGGVAVIAAFVDTDAVLNGVTILGTSGDSVQEFECCGFTATTIVGP